MTTMREQTKWMDRAMCVAAGMRRWETFTTDEHRRICHGCPVNRACAEWSGQTPPTPTVYIGHIIGGEHR